MNMSSKIGRLNQLIPCKEGFRSGSQPNKVSCWHRRVWPVWFPSHQPWIRGSQSHKQAQHVMRLIYHTTHCVFVPAAEPIQSRYSGSWGWLNAALLWLYALWTTAKTVMLKLATVKTNRVAFRAAAFMAHISGSGIRGAVWWKRHPGGARLVSETAIPPDT